MYSFSVVAAASALAILPACAQGQVLPKPVPSTRRRPQRKCSSRDGSICRMRPLIFAFKTSYFSAIGDRALAMIVYNITPEFLASAFITRAIGNDIPLPQRTLSNIVFTYNAIPALKRTGLF